MAAATGSASPPDSSNSLPLASFISEVDLLSLIEWDPEKFGIGVRTIDEQHKILISLANDLTLAYAAIAYPGVPLDSSQSSREALAAAIERSASTYGSISVGDLATFPVVGGRQFDSRLQRGSKVSGVVENLVSYTCKYLMVEDHMLETYAYVDRAMQQQDHELFSNEVSFMLKLTEDFQVQLADVRRLLVFLRLWLTGHIPRDRKYAPMLIEKGVGT